GIYHYTGATALTRYEFAKAILEVAVSIDEEDRPENAKAMSAYRAALASLQAISSNEYPSAAIRPNYTVLDCRKIMRLGIAVKPLMHDLPHIVRQLMQGRRQPAEPSTEPAKPATELDYALNSPISVCVFMHLLVTAGAGFMGSAMVRHLVAQGADKVINVDKLSYAANMAAIASVMHSPQHVFEQVDICNRAELDRIFAQHQPQAVIHLAAESHVDRSIHGPDVFIQSNVTGTYTLLEATRQYWQALPNAKRQVFRFLHVSTDEVYGDLADSKQRFTEQTAYAPSSPYSASKAASDHLVHAWHRTYGLPVLISHCTNNY